MCVAQQPPVSEPREVGAAWPGPTDEKSLVIMTYEEVS